MDQGTVPQEAVTVMKTSTEDVGDERKIFQKRDIAVKTEYEQDVGKEIFSLKNNSPKLQAIKRVERETAIRKTQGPSVEGLNDRESSHAPNSASRSPVQIVGMLNVVAESDGSS